MNLDDSTGSFFSEIQRFRQIWVWMIIIVISGMMWYFFINQFFLDSPDGREFMPKALMILFWAVFGIGFPLMFFFGGLHTQVRNDALYIRFAPFHFTSKKIAYDTIARCEVRTYNAMTEYGGWGIKYGKGGKSYTVSGNQGVQLEFMTGKPLLIGSQRAEELYQSIRLRLS